MTGASPLVRLAAAFVAGVAVGLAGAPAWVAPLLVLVARPAPIPASQRPRWSPLALAAAAGLIGALPSSPTRCVEGHDADAGRLEGYFLAAPRTGSAPFERIDGCGTVTVVMENGRGVPAGRLLRVEGRWMEGRIRPWFHADPGEVQGLFGAGGPGAVAEDRGSAAQAVHRALVRRRDALVARLPRLYGEHAPLVAALVFARREGMDRDVREAFARAGIAHLLAISGFHVGVVAGLALALLRSLGVSRRRSALGAAGLASAYVAFIGFPDAACRAALLLGIAAAARARGRPAARWSGLGAAGLTLLLVDPAKAASAGFQLSFAGAAGLVAWARPLDRWLAARAHTPGVLRSALAAGVAATVATLPIVAWHFGRITLAGIPMTLVASPLVTVALPAALVTIALDPLLPGVAAFLAGGVRVLLEILVAGTSFTAALPGTGLAVTRPTVAAAAAGAALATVLARRPGIGGPTRRRMILAYGAAAVLAWPLAVGIQGRGTLELVAIDVGQGDAIGIRSPRGRWVLVDAGPPTRDTGRHPVVDALRSRGVRRLERLVLTHPDADHFGGAIAVFDAFAVGAVLDPLVPAPKDDYAALLRRAREVRVPWIAARRGTRWEIDEVEFEVLHPSPDLPVDPAEANDASIVLEVRWRGFTAVLTGDAYVAVERSLMDRIGDVDLLKVGHHGSRTSTDPDFLDRVDPEIALLSVGRRNRYGHPAPEVVARLRSVGAEIFRTDRHGTVRVRVRRNGVVDVRTER